MTLNEAKISIAEILAQLEIDTDGLVKHIGLTQIDATGMKDDRRVLVMQVDIELERKPGHSWGVAR